jgi:hypothetical protein
MEKNFTVQVISSPGDPYIKLPVLNGTVLQRNFRPLSIPL